MEAGDNYDLMLLHFKEYSVRKAANSRPASLPVNDGELPWVVRNCPDRVVDRQCKTLPKLWANVVLPCPRVQQILVCLG